MIDYVFRDITFVRVYLNDVAVFSDSMSSHAEHLLQVFEVIAKSKLKLIIEKCMFAQSQTKLLGHVFSAEGIAVDQEKISTIVKTPQPRTVTEMRSFLGRAGYYRPFIPRFAVVSSILHAATSAKVKFSFTEEIRSSFEESKRKLTRPPLLPLPDFDVPFVVETDSSSVAVGAVLEQKKKDGKIHPVQYARDNDGDGKRLLGLRERSTGRYICFEDISSFSAFNTGIPVDYGPPVFAVCV